MLADADFEEQVSVAWFYVALCGAGLLLSPACCFSLWLLEFTSLSPSPWIPFCQGTDLSSILPTS